MYISLEKLLANNVTPQLGSSLETDCLALSIMVALTLVIFGALGKIASWIMGRSAIVLAQDRGSRIVLLIVTTAITPFVLTFLLPELPLSPTLWLFALLGGVGVFMILEVLLPPSTGGR